MTTLRLRPLGPDDLPSLPSLLSALNNEPVAWDADHLARKILRDPDYDPALSPVIEAHGRVVALVHGVIRGSDSAFLKVFAVAPRYRRRGLATRLLDEFEAQARTKGARRVRLTFSPPAYLSPGVDLRYTAALHLLLNRGYETDRRASVHMGVALAAARLDTSADEARLAARGIAVRRATPADQPAALALAVALGGQNWHSEVCDAYSYDPIRLQVAAHDSAIIAFAAQDVVGPTQFGPTGTDPAYRRQGIGTVLLKRCMREVLAHGHRRAEIAGAGPVAYYIGAVGATISRIYWAFEKAL